MAPPENSANAASLRRECKLYLLFYQFYVAIGMLILLGIFGAIEYPAYMWIYLVHGGLAAVVAVLLITVHRRFLGWPIDQQLDYLYSPRIKRAAIIGASVLVVIILVPLLLGGPVMMVVGPGQTMLILPLIFPGVVLAGVGSGYREGRSVHCASCDYDQGPLSQVQDLAPVCPECGQRWLVRGGTVVGKRIRSWRLLVVGCGLVISPFLVSMGSLGLLMPGAPSVMPYSPTSSLILMARAGDFRAEDAWTELAQRDLTETQIAELHGFLIESTPEGEYFRRGGSWLRAALEANLLTSEQFVPLLARLEVNMRGVFGFWGHMDDFEFSEKEVREVARFVIQYADQFRSIPEISRPLLEDALARGIIDGEQAERLRAHLDQYKPRPKPQPTSP